MRLSLVTTLWRHSHPWKTRALRDEVEQCLKLITVDFGGGCSPSKALVMAELIRVYQLNITADIGVYRGRSLLPQALAHRMCGGGLVYGIDPWSAAEAHEEDLSTDVKARLDTFLATTDFDAMYRDVQALISQLELQQHCVLVRETSANAAQFFQAENVEFDLIHIDGNHDTRKVRSDVSLYLPRLRTGGFLLLDDVSWGSIRPVYQETATKLPLVFQRQDASNDYAVFWKETSLAKVQGLRCVLRFLGSRQNGA